MKIKIRNELIPLNLLVLFLILVIILLPSNVLRIILGLPFLLFIPGYTLMAAMFPREERLSGIERLALSFVLSIVVVPFMGLIINYTPWGIRLETILYSTTAFIIITSAIAWLGRRRLTESERYRVEFELTLPGWEASVSSKVLSVALVVAIIGALGVMTYVIVTPKEAVRFTELYIEVPEGKGEWYPEKLAVGEEGAMVVGIVNHEQQKVNYRLEVTIDGTRTREVGPIVLENDRVWKELVAFAPDKVGSEQKVEFLLYREGQSEVYRSAYVSVDVTE